jgi:hypothetical protein
VSLLANHSHIVALQIDDAGSVAELKAAAGRLDAMVALLHDGGIKIERIARLVGELNHRIFARLWGLLAPPELVANSCLLVMGSEGRGEQTIKTDQDTPAAADDLTHPQLPDAAALNAALVEPATPLPRQHHADQSAVAQRRSAVSRQSARVDLRQRPGRPDAPGDLRRGGRAGDRHARRRTST